MWTPDTIHQVVECFDVEASGGMSRYETYCLREGVRAFGRRTLDVDDPARYLRDMSTLIDTCTRLYELHRDEYGEDTRRRLFVVLHLLRDHWIYTRVRGDVDECEDTMYDTIRYRYLVTNDGYPYPILGYWKLIAYGVLNYEYDQDTQLRWVEAYLSKRQDRYVDGFYRWLRLVVGIHDHGGEQVYPSWVIHWMRLTYSAVETFYTLQRGEPYVELTDYVASVTDPMRGTIEIPIRLLHLRYRPRPTSEVVTTDQVPVFLGDYHLRDTVSTPTLQIPIRYKKNRNATCFLTTSNRNLETPSRKSHTTTGRLSLRKK